MNRRRFLQWMGAGVLLTFCPYRLLADVNSPPADVPRLARDLANLIGTREIGLDLRRMTPGGDELFRVQVNASELYPVASCFKAFLVLYYYWYTPRELWQDGENTPVRSVAVFSNNVQTGVLIDTLAQRLDYFGNAVQKFNDFGLYTLGLRNGMHTWNWPNTPTEGATDPRFAPSDRRYINFRGERVQMDNLYTAAEFADFYARLLRPSPFPDYPAAAEAVARTLSLLSIPAESYESPFERAFPNGYTGKDGVLPVADSAVGRVINDAGILSIRNGTYVFAFMSAGESDVVSIRLLREIAALLEAFEPA